MEVALGAADWLLGQVLNKLSDDLVKAYVSSTELGLNLGEIEREMLYTRGLLNAAQGRDVTGNPGLKGLLEKLGKKADEAEDTLDELHYFIIQDKLDGTQDAAPDLGDGLSAKAQHARQAARHTSGNWLPCFSCCRSQDDVAAADDDVVHNHSGHIGTLNTSNVRDGNLPFDRVSMSNKIKQLIEELHSHCTPVSDLLKIVSANSPQPHMPTITKRPDTSSQITQEKLFGRDDIFEKTIDEIVSVAQSDQTLSVLPIVGPGGIGKTTFTQHLVNDTRIKKCFPDNVWICVSTNFDVTRLTKEILSCLPATENGGNQIANESTTNLDLLQKSIAQRLKSKRILIVLDDIWECNSTDNWEKLLAPFKNDEASGNMILVTTRFPKIAEMVKKETNPIDLRGLDPDEFWKFFQICAFGRIQGEHGDQELIGIAKQIADKLKCSPLAAKTVGRLLIKKPFQEHWMKILDNKEWLEENHDDDIIPALKISYDFLPFHLKKCFSFFSLFPDDYKFEKLEVIRFWDSIGIIDYTRKNKKIEDIGSDYLDELLDNGFLMKVDANYYVMHDSLHDLSRIVSLEECAYISCSNLEASQIPKTIRYLSIFMHDTHIQSFEEEMVKLKERIDIKNLRSLMIFGEYSRLHLINVLRDTFKEIKGLRVLTTFMNSYSSLPNNFSKLLHLRYLKLISPSYSKMSLPSIVCRFCHLKFLDLKHWRSGYSLPNNICRLENLRHFVATEDFHSNVPEVGKMKFLQELKEFHVRKESVGFELGELGKLEDLGGELNISGLENVRTRQEANEAKLIAKRNLVKLGLVWNNKQDSSGDDILDSIQPHSNIRRLCIVNHGGSVGPSWLFSNIIYMRNLETLHLESVSWANLPPIGQMYHLRKLKLKNIVGISQIGPDFFGGTTEKSFTRLKEVQLYNMPKLLEWTGGGNCHLFSGLEKIRCIHCPRLTRLLISGWPNNIWFPSLCELRIRNCPELCLPPLPHTSKISRIETECLSYYDRTSLTIRKPSKLAFRNLHGMERLSQKSIGEPSDMTFKILHGMERLQNLAIGERSELSIQNLGYPKKLSQGLSTGKPSELAFENLGEVARLTIQDASLLSLMGLRMLHSLKHLRVNRCEETILRGLDNSVVLHKVQSLGLDHFPLTRKSLSNLFACFPALSRLDVTASDEDHGEVVLQFPSSCLLRDIRFCRCKNLILPVEQGFLGLSSLESLHIVHCEKLFSRWSTGGAAQSQSIIINPLPHFLKELDLWGDQSTLPTALLVNLTSLTSLVLVDRSGESKARSIAAELVPAVTRTIETTPVGSFQLVELEVDSITAVLVDPICKCLSATLQRIVFDSDWRTERFTEEQEKALQHLTSLQILSFADCIALRFLPQGLHRLPSLQQLRIEGTKKIRSLPKEGLPNSLRELYIDNCCPEIFEECQKLRGTRPDIHVTAYIARVQS